MAAVTHPSRTILLADSATFGENSTNGFSIQNDPTNSNISRRHSGGAHIAWVSGGVEYKTGDELDEILSHTGNNARYWSANQD